MQNADDLRSLLRRVDGASYKAYKDLRGGYDFGRFQILVDHVQGDPVAAPSLVLARVRRSDAAFPATLTESLTREIALRDFLTRALAEAAGRIARGDRGLGTSGLIGVDRPGQEVLRRSSVVFTRDFVEARVQMGLPAQGRRISGRDATAMFFEELPAIVSASLFHAALDADAARRHVDTVSDAQALRSQLRDQGLVAFVADGALLPRISGVDQQPMPAAGAVPFRSPPELRVTLDAPHAGPVTGMGIRAGVTLIVGGGYHGKSTLLRALERGVYDHVPGDGRERVVTDPTAVKIRAEDGRRVAGVDISPFISSLPGGRETLAFSTDEASGSTSQAANIVEAIEAGARVLLVDEDTSATNFMIRDHRMQELVRKDMEPITPFVDKVEQLHRDLGVSTVLVIGGSGDYFETANSVICMGNYEPEDVTARARAIAERTRSERAREGGERMGELRPRVPLAQSFDPSRGKRDVKISARGTREVVFGTHAIDLTAVDQVVDESQTRAIGEGILLATRFMDGRRTLSEVLDRVDAEIAERGLEALSSYPRGDLAAFRRMELAAAINRLRTLEVRPSS
jgi:predicted ABC-class ATPase